MAAPRLICHAVISIWSLVSAGVHAAEDTEFRGLPSLICADRTTTNLCHDARRLVQDKTAAFRAALPNVTQMPMIACEQPGTHGPCSSQVCGDKICAFGEIGHCAKDCPVPAKVDICRCMAGGCQRFHIECDATGCSSTAVPASPDFCRCSAPDGSQVCEAEYDKMCQVMRFAQPIVGCELVRFNTGARRSESRCSDKSCPPRGFGLADDNLLLSVKKTAVEGPK